MLITLARPWTDPASGTEYAAGADAEVADDIAGQMLRDGVARAAGRVIEDDPTGELAIQAALDDAYPNRERAADDVEDAEVNGAAPDDNGAEPPPQTGEGSTREAWLEYAAAVGVELDPETTRKDIVQALKDAGKPVEPAQHDPESPATGHTSEGVS